MAENSAIQWTNHLLPKPFSALQSSLIADTVGLEMFQFVTGMAKGFAVGNLKSKFGVIGKGLYMMGAKITTAIISAILASVIVSGKNGFAPILILGFAAVAFAPLCQAALVCGVLFASRGAFSCNSADFSAGFRGVLFAQTLLISLSGRAHFLLGVFRVCFPPKGRRPSARRGIRIVNTPTILAGRSTTVGPAVINVEFNYPFPSAAPAAMLFAVGDTLRVLIGGDSDTACRNSQSTLSCLRHICTSMLFPSTQL